MNKTHEVRTFEIDELEIRASDGDEGKRISGHAAVFNKMSEDLGGFREVIEPGAFERAIKRDDVRALFNHDPNYILGRNKAGTLRLEEDEKGLAIEVDLPDTSYARDLEESIGRGDISQMSFAFNIDGEKGEWWEVDGEKVKNFWAALDAMWDDERHEIVRHVVKARLYDVSPVTYPAYPQTDVKARGLPGIAFEELEGAMVKLRSGKDLSDEEKSTLVKAGEMINGYVPEETGDEARSDADEEPAEEGTGGSGYEQWLGKMRRELELAELN